MAKKTFLAQTLVFTVFFLQSICFAQTPPASQQMSGEERSRQMLEQERKLRQEIERPKEKAQIEEKLPQEPGLQGPPGQKILVKNINVVGVTLFPDAKIKAITSQYENKELNLKEIQQIADRITDLYRQKGYITSRAYVAPQKIKDASLEIRVMEATVGDIQIKGNRFYSSKIIKRYVTLEKGGFFNYNDLKKDLVLINEHPDRNAKAILAPGKEPGSTDVLLDVKDSLPIPCRVQLQ